MWVELVPDTYGTVPTGWAPMRNVRFVQNINESVDIVHERRRRTDRLSIETSLLENVRHIRVPGVPRDVHNGKERPRPRRERPETLAAAERRMYASALAAVAFAGAGIALLIGMPIPGFVP